ncbi:MAG: hypothetical protein KUG70_14610 [Rhodobacteraceae bacterium]|jgi:hypothetical protein|uniref:hypothetical protein n=1 Tax=unclassified Sulfitobacter TaxID=196795 RepID=UPI0023E0EC5A|nr:MULTISPECIES: hypothetical protein [unclassified Sulfitobacter]MBV1897690.1 hypothetical protein [Paracoccaceae bacterium]MDF3416441.1 hypothetical protein [Sulfitobacter sp. KE5]MDF3423921.1 hypothetical protein [Sulfitobacter sp. KE43]MDF3434987.1 hypothetical protein [Sulfitobacter sp. KE42]MDF3460626.1 hypothetical protein [Sulfitobacter sp. S74]
MFKWFKKIRQTHSKIGFLVHLAGQWLAVGMMIYFWRAMIHLLDTVEAFAEEWQRSSSEHFEFIDGLVAIPAHLISEPIYFLQLTSIVIVLHLTVNRTGYRGSAYVPHKPNHGGIAIFAAMTLFR